VVVEPRGFDLPVVPLVSLTAVGCRIVGPEDGGRRSGGVGVGEPWMGWGGRLGRCLARQLTAPVCSRTPVRWTDLRAATSADDVLGVLGVVMA